MKLPELKLPRGRCRASPIRRGIFGRGRRGILVILVEDGVHVAAG